MTRADLKTNVQAVLEVLANPSDPYAVTYPLIHSYEDGPRPAGPYLSMNLMGATRPGLPYVDPKITGVTAPEDVGDQQIIWNEDPVFSLQGYGSASEGVLETMANALETEAAKEALDEKFLAIRNITSIREISDFFDEQPERRFVMEITFGIAKGVVDHPGWIGDITLEETYLPPQ